MDDASNLKNVHKRTQEALIVFLNAEIDLGFTFLNTAEIAGDTSHYEQALSNTTEAIATVRRLQHKIDDVGVWNSLHARANELETHLSAFNRT